MAAEQTTIYTNSRGEPIETVVSADGSVRCVRCHLHPDECGCRGRCDRCAEGSREYKVNIFPAEGGFADTDSYEVCGPCSREIDRLITEHGKPGTGIERVGA